MGTSSKRKHHVESHINSHAMGKLVWILLLGFCLLVVNADTEKAEKEEESADDDAAEEDADAGSGSEEAEATDAEEGEAEEAGETKEFQCNLKFKRIGCYADKGKKDKPLVSFMESDEDLSANANVARSREASTNSTASSPNSHANAPTTPSTAETPSSVSRTSPSAGRDPTIPNTTKTVHPRIASPSTWPNARRTPKCAPERSTSTSCTTSTHPNTPRPPTRSKKSSPKTPRRRKRPRRRNRRRS